LEILSKQPRSSSEVFGDLPQLTSTPEITIKLDRDGEQHDFMRAFAAAARFPEAAVTLIDGVRADFAFGWGLLRASNTTSALVARFEAEDEVDLMRIQDTFRKQILAANPSLALPF